jgi:magnesium-protoporphyrin IX monomethyl ester (oxidative) cyclase
MTIETLSLTPRDTQKMAEETTMLSPRFYTTDFDALDRMDVSSVRREWDDADRRDEVRPQQGPLQAQPTGTISTSKACPKALRKEFIDFLVSSLTAEFSGCVLYKEMKKRGNNPDICELFADEPRRGPPRRLHQRCAEGFGIGVNLGFLTKAKKYTYFKPKFIFYATYLSEKIGYARYITIFRQLERIRSAGSTRSSSGSKSGATTSSATARPLRC